MTKIFLFLLLCTGSFSYGQSIKIYGQVTDSVAGPLPGATVMLIGQEDSILKSFAVTDKEGNFVIQNVKQNDYLFKANFYGYQPYELQFSVNEASKDTAVGIIALQPKMLDVVTIDADYIPIRIKGDTIEYDSRAFETGEHDVVENLLEQLPGVQVQPDGSIKVQGKTVEKILVDGEEFFGNDPTIATKNLPADAVDKVQVFEKDSDMATFTGVDDGNEATTINLTLKEDRKKGYFGNLEAAYGLSETQTTEPTFDDSRYKLKGNIHYFKGKWQVSGIGLSNNVNETGFSINDYISFMGGIQNLLDGSGTLSLDGDQGLPLSNGRDNGFLNTNALGFNLNYKPSKKASVSSSIFFNTFDKTYNRSIDRTTFFQDSSIFSQEEVVQENNTYNNRGNIHYKQEFDSTHFLNLNFTGQWTQSRNSNNNGLQNFDTENILRNSFMTELDQDRFQYKGSISADYRKKFAKKGRYTGLGATYGLDNSDANGNLIYQNAIYLTDPIILEITQKQLDERLNSNFNANWMWSEPITKKNLLQFQLAHYRNSSQRNREVYDVTTPDNSVFNNLFSGNATYENFTHEGQIRHKYLSKKIKTTAGLSYQNLTLLSDELFTERRSYDYILPFARLQWEPNKSSEIRIDYRTEARAPGLVQLQTIPNNTNPAELVLGNTNLNPEYIHDLSVEYNLFNEFNFTHFMVRLGAARTENKINYSQVVDTNFNRIFTPENNGKEDQLNAFLSFGTNLSPLKTKFNITNNANISQGQLLLNNEQNRYTSIYNNSALTIENTKKKVFNIRAGLETTYSQSIYPENEALNGNFFSWNYSGDITYKLKDNWVFNANAKHQFFPSFENNNEQIIVNASIARNLLKSKKLQVYMAAFDLLNQNTGINQSYFLNYYEQERTATLARYVMVGLKYSFQKLGGK